MMTKSRSSCLPILETESGVYYCPVTLSDEYDCEICTIIENRADFEFDREEGR